MLDFTFEREFIRRRSLTGLVAGLDEAGRGPIAGPVTAAAVILDPDNLIVGLDDSKKLSAAQRERLAVEIREKSLAWGIGWGCVGEIARENIIGASFLAMRRALDRLTVESVFLLVDGPAQRLHFPRLKLPAVGIVKGDSKVASIAAASILAKTARDAMMARYDEMFPGYGFAANKGYGKPALDALKRLGATPIHRYSWAAVQQATQQHTSNFKANQILM